MHVFYTLQQRRAATYKYRYRYVLVCTCMYEYEQVWLNMYKHVQIDKNEYSYVQICTSMKEYVQPHYIDNEKTNSVACLTLQLLFYLCNWNHCCPAHSPMGRCSNNHQWYWRSHLNIDRFLIYIRLCLLIDYILSYDCTTISDFMTQFNESYIKSFYQYIFLFRQKLICWSIIPWLRS